MSKICCVMFFGVCFVLSTTRPAKAQVPPKCEEQLVLANQLLQDLSQRGSQLQVELAQERIKVQALTKAPVVVETKKDAKK